MGFLEGFLKGKNPEDFTWLGWKKKHVFLNRRYIFSNAVGCYIFMLVFWGGVCNCILGGQECHEII